MNYTDAIIQLQSEGTFSGAILTHNGNQAQAYTELYIHDVTGKDIRPSEQALIDAHGRFVIAQTLETQKQSDLQTTREANKTALNPTDYSAESLLIQALAAKIVWLEKEINDLRGNL